MSRGDPYRNLYNAVRDFLLTQGGDAIMGLGVYIQENPADKDRSFSVCVKMVGRKPARTIEDEADAGGEDT